MSGNDVGTSNVLELAKYIGNDPSCSLTHLYLNNVNMTDSDTNIDGALALFASLAANKSLFVLSLKDNHLQA